MISPTDGHESADKKPDLALVDLTAVPSGRRRDGNEIIEQTRARYSVPVIAVISGDRLAGYEPLQGIDDFIVAPCPVPEIEARIRQVLWAAQNLKNETIVKRGDIVINLSSYKVFLAGKPVDLTFKEFELLRFLAASPGKVFSRESLLNQVWGYDYYGGDRTVDVHIRRLRSKIEDATHSFIETVWNVGYSFKE